jgi:6-phosphogluconolactonase
MKNKFSRREFLALTAGGLLAAQTNFAKSFKGWNPKNMLVYIGTYTTKTKSEGIYIYKLNLSSGELSPYKIAGGAVDPSYLAIDKKHKFLYAVNETEEYEGAKSGAVSAYRIDEKTGELTFLNKQASLGGSPCYLSISDNGKFVLVANYSGGNVAVFPIEADGSLGASVDFKQNSGNSVNKDRQNSAHAHSITLDRKNNFAVACDLGIDKALIYQFDDKTGKLQPNSAQAFFQAKPGAGPRHFVFHANHKLAFLINELDSTVTALRYDEKQGTLAEIQTVTTLPENYARAAANTCADVHLSPDGKFLYGSNRGHNSIVSYKVDEENGTLELVEHISTKGKTPRNFAIDPTGNFLLAANQNSGNIVVFRIDNASGKLLETGFSASVPAPVCLKLIPEKD